MGTTQTAGGISAALFGKVRRAVLALLFLDPEQPRYLRQIVREVGAGRGAVQRELQRMTEAGLILKSRKGNLVLYQADKDSPVFSEIRGLLIKTVGIADSFRASLTEMSDRVEIAFVFGSIAAGTDRSDSDIDVLIVGSIGVGDLNRWAIDREREMKRRVNYTLFSPSELAERLCNNDEFLANVLASPKIMLIGDENAISVAR